MEVVHDRDHKEFKIELDKSSADKGFSSSFFKYNQIFFVQLI
jgi:hypothetical protein